MPTKELHFPTAGVNRRMSLRNGAGRREVYFAPWSVNVRTEDPLDRRLRGGSRPGLTLYVENDMGTTIDDIASVNTSSTSGVEEILFVLVDTTITTIEGGVGGTVATPVANLTTATPEPLVDVSQNNLVASTALPPAPGAASGFLLTGQQMVFAVTSNGITQMDPKTGSVTTLVATAGTIPTGCSFGAIYRDRLCMSGEDNAIYVSRQGDYTDWDFGAHFEDDQRALAYQLSLSADVGPLPTAMIPCKDDYMVCATARSLWVVQGDPTTGNLQRISETVGIIGSKAWVKVDSQIIFLSEDGLYTVGVDGSNLTPMTPDAVPMELRDIDLTTTTVSLGYDHDRREFHIYLRTDDGSDIHWVYETTSQALWPMSISDNHTPRAVCQCGGKLLLAGNDGYIRYVAGDTDEGAAIPSHVVLGPVRLSDPNYYGRIRSMHANIAAGSGTVNWRVVTGNTAEEAADNAKLAIEAFQISGDYSSYVSHTGAWTAGRANMAYPRPRAVWMCLWLESSAKWGYEGVIIETEPSGRWRGN